MLRLGEVTKATVEAETITRVIAQDWQDGAIEADSLVLLNVLGDFHADLTLTGNDTNPRFTLTRAIVRGGVNSSIWNVTGDANQIVILGHVDGWSIDARGIGLLNVRQDLRDAQLTLRVNDAEQQVLDRLLVGRWLDGTSIDTTGSVGHVVAGGMRDSRLRAGLLDVDQTPPSLPETSETFNEHFDALAHLRACSFAGSLTSRLRWRPRTRSPARSTAR